MNSELQKNNFNFILNFLIRCLFFTSFIEAVIILTGNNNNKLLRIEFVIRFGFRDKFGLIICCEVVGYDVV